jgi:hypothetical protein
MRRFLLALSLPVLAAFAAPVETPREEPPFQADSAASVQFKSKAPAVGDKYTSTEESLMKMALAAKGQSVTIEQHETEERKIELLALKDGLPSKIRVRYAQHRKDAKSDGKPKPSPSPVHGKTYLVERKGSELVVTNEQGKAVSDEEREQVTKDHRRLGKPDEITSALKSKPRKVGDKLDDVAKALADQFKERSAERGEKVTIHAPKLTFTELKKIDGVEHAVLDLSLRMGAENKDVTLTMDLKGKVLVRVDEASHGEINVSGPLKISGGASGDGSVTLKTKTGP